MANDYQLLDSGLFRRLERLGEYKISRPAAAAVWSPGLAKADWGKADAVFERKSGGEGSWKKFNKKIPERWPVQIGSIRMYASLTDFGHIGLFPEHHSAIDVESCITQFQKEFKRPFRLLNLFAYTGAISSQAAHLGAEVVHLDASKTSVAWARENAELSGLSEKPIRWIVDDVQKFVAREIKRNNEYDGVILDPPSYGRGSKGQMWKIEDHLIPLLDQLNELASPEFSFVKLSAHTPGYTPITLANLLKDSFHKCADRLFSRSFEMTVTEKSKNRKLPSGACALLSRYDT